MKVPASVLKKMVYGAGGLGLAATVGFVNSSVEPQTQAPLPAVSNMVSVEPTAEPTVEPTAEPTAEPTPEPTVAPTAAPIDPVPFPWNCIGCGMG